MSRGTLTVWLLMKLGSLYLTPAASETVTAFLGQSVTLPCRYSSWSQSYSMCWGKGQCPNSKCNEEIVHTDGLRVLSRRSAKYELQGDIQRGDVSLTIFNTDEGDSSVYCCRIEVPGWFNDVKKNIHLQLRRATTRLPTTSTGLTTPTAGLPATTAVTPELTTAAPHQAGTAAARTTAATCPPTSPRALPGAVTARTSAPPAEGPAPTAESQTFLLPSDSQRSTEVTSGDSALLTSKESKGWVFQSTSQASTWETSVSVTFPQLRASETTILEQNEVESEQIKVTDNSDLLMIIAPSVGFVLLSWLVVFLLRGKVKKSNCFQKHTRLDNVGESKNVLDDIQHGREDEDSLFTL
ncbi:T-cell immunoglobulin and mucin domain-containing protein 4 [Manis javanica]|nr:T-cell immunoglobulin and mucin domain-containing protein 4 [Manis javanica]